MIHIILNMVIIILKHILKAGKWADTDKAETRLPDTFEEGGTLPDERGEKAPAMAALIDAIDAGYGTAEIIRDNPKFALQSKSIDTLRETLTTTAFQNRERDIKVIYLFGATGTGKTRSIFDSHPYKDICRITNYGNESGIKFDSYHGQKVLVFEEFSSNIPISDMLNYLDRYPVSLPARYTDRTACYDTVYITSNLSLRDQYPAIQSTKTAVWRAFLRRITRVDEFTKGGVIPHSIDEYY